MTVNSPVPAQTGDWLGIPFILGDNSGSVTYGGYAGMFGFAGTASPRRDHLEWQHRDRDSSTWVGRRRQCSAACCTIQGGGDFLYNFNLELDPAVLPTGVSAYDVTFNSLTFRSSVPEPSSFALAGPERCCAPRRPVGARNDS